MNKDFQNKISESDSFFCFLNFENTEILGAGIKHQLNSDDLHSQKVDDFLAEHKNEFIFCFLSYKLKESTIAVKDVQKNIDSFPGITLIVPEQIHEIKSQFESSVNQNAHSKKINFPSKENYIQTVNKIKDHIQYGDFYETNYCICPQIEAKIDPFQTYLNLESLTQAPFSSFIKYNNEYLICGSPERFLKKDSHKVISQPIKGTAKRSENSSEDQELKNQLKNSLKEQTENIMIVDLVRNDLSKIAKRNSVKVENLNEVKSYKTVHQLVSTVSCEIEEGKSFSDIIEALFPMGSMTGAPKKRAVELMTEYEDFSRGIYSGSVGLIKPNGDFDLNVVIRSIIYNEKDEKVYMPVGSAITIQSDPEKEYEECKLKAEALMRSISYED